MRMICCRRLCNASILEPSFMSTFLDSTITYGILIYYLVYYSGKAPGWQVIFCINLLEAFPAHSDDFAFLFFYSPALSDFPPKKRILPSGGFPWGKCKISVRLLFYPLLSPRARSSARVCKELASWPKLTRRVPVSRVPALSWARGAQWSPARRAMPLEPK